MQNIKNIHESISKMLVERLEKFKGKSLDDFNCLSIYQTIFDSFQEIFLACGVKVTNDAMNYMAQQYYDAVSINGREQLNPNIFTQRASLDDIPTNEIVLLAMLFKGTDFAMPLYKKLRTRS